MKLDEPDLDPIPRMGATRKADLAKPLVAGNMVVVEEENKDSWKVLIRAANSGVFTGEIKGCHDTGDRIGTEDHTGKMVEFEKKHIYLIY